MSKLNFKSFQQTRILCLTAITSLILVISMVLPFGALEAHGLTDNNYTTSQFAVKFVVNEDRSIDVTEKIDVNFVKPSHGIYRNIPLTWKSTFGYKGVEQSEKSWLRIKNVKCNEKNKVYEDAGQKIIQIGHPAKYVEGPKSYEISYKVVAGKDTFDDFDFIFNNLKPTGWRNDIAKFKYEVIFPKEVAAKDIQIFDQPNSIPVEQDKYTVKNKGGKTYVTGEFDNVLEGDPVSIFATMPEGYFSKAIDYPTLYGRLWAGGCVALLIASIILAMVFGRDAKMVKTVEFYPPDGMGPMEMAGCINAYDDKKVLTSTIIYLADKGYLTLTKVTENGESMLLTRINKEAENQLPEGYQSFLKSMFEFGDEVRLDELPLDTVDALQNITLMYSRPPQMVGEVTDFKSQLIEGFMALLHLVLGLGFAIYLGLVNLVSLDTAAAVGLVCLSGLLSYALINWAVSGAGAKNMKGLKQTAAFLLMFACGIKTMGLTEDDFGSGFYALIATLSVYIGMQFIAHIDRVTETGAAIRGRIYGFKDFLIRVEKDKLEKLVEEDPNYFFNILPYTYILGISDLWMDKISEDIKPDWYNDDYSDVYVDTMFARVITNSVYRGIDNKIAESIAHQAEIDGNTLSGFSGGGGFGGGGMGGGGGGSW